MVDLHLLRGALSPHKTDDGSGIRGCQGAGQNQAAVGSRLQREFPEITAQDIVALITPVAIEITPALPELVPRVTGFRCTALDRQSGQRRCR